MDKDILNLDEFEVVSLEENDSGDYLFNVRPKTPAAVCPECGSADVVNNGAYNRLARDVSCRGHKVSINIMGNRHKCRDCGTTFCDAYKSVEANAKITVRLKDRICESAVREPFLRIAEEQGITMPTVKRIFMDHVRAEEEKRVLYSPPVLGIGETALNKHNRRVIIDVGSRRVIELLESCAEDRLTSFLRSLPDTGNIRVVTMNMRRSCAEAVNACLPGARIVIDRAYAEGAVYSAFKSVWKETAGVSHTDIRPLKYLMCNYEDLNGSQVKELDNILAENRKLKAAYALKEGFRRIYSCGTRREAESLYAAWAKEIPEDLKEFQTVRGMIDNWHAEIFNFFDCGGDTNGIAELLDSLSGSVESRGRGYTFEVIRAKLLFSARTADQP